ncbi:helicase associated domain-containing protein [Streptomyces nogalater]
MPGEDPDAWLHFDRPTQAEEVALALSLRVLAPKSAEWRRGLMTARRYHRTHHHLDVPQTYEDPTGYPWAAGSPGSATSTPPAPSTRPAPKPLNASASSGIPASRPSSGVGTRSRLRCPQRPPRRSDRLPPRRLPLGRWLATQRTRAHHLTTERAATLTALDPWWNPPWPITWQRAYHAARRQIQQDPAAVGEWLTAQRQRTSDLRPEQRRLLNELAPDLPDLHAPHTEDTPLPPRERAFQRGLAAARAYLEREDISTSRSGTSRRSMGTRCGWGSG